MLLHARVLARRGARAVHCLGASAASSMANTLSTPSFFINKITTRFSSSSSSSSSSPGETLKSTFTADECVAYATKVPPERIRNFCIIAHIDHGKSTLADRLLELAGNIKHVENRMEGRVLDSLQIEQERGITIKAQSVTMVVEHGAGDAAAAAAATVGVGEEGSGNYNHPDVANGAYVLNMIDTPGHVDFSYEVSRSLAACQGAVLLVDCSQGVQAQTLANFYLALEADLTIVPVLTKTDLPHADVKGATEELITAFGVEREDILQCSAKTGTGVAALFDAIVRRISPPSIDDSTADTDAHNDEAAAASKAVDAAAPRAVAKHLPFRGLLFDSWYDIHRGVICLVYVTQGALVAGARIGSYHAEGRYETQEVGILTPGQSPVSALHQGMVGYVVAGIRSVRDAMLGDTLFAADKRKGGGDDAEGVVPLDGFEQSKPMVFAGLFPTDSGDFEELTVAIDKLLLTDASVVVHKENSDALGMGFRCGFLGMLHMNVFAERLDVEFASPVMMTAPSVPFQAVMKSDGEVVTIDAPSKFPDVVRVSEFREAIVRASVIAPTSEQGSMMELCGSHRGQLVDFSYLGASNQRVHLRYTMPLAEIVGDFYDRLKAVSSGYASFDYETAGFEKADLVKLVMCINKAPVDALSFVCPADKAASLGAFYARRLKESINRQNFEVILQAYVGSKSVARERVAPYRKDVLIKSGKTVGGGDESRKMKLINKQKEGKKRMKTIGRVEVGQDVFLSVMQSKPPSAGKGGGGGGGFASARGSTNKTGGKTNKHR
jgi:GTP-binding protein LepA